MCAESVVEIEFLGHHDQVVMSSVHLSVTIATPMPVSWNFWQPQKLAHGARGRRRRAHRHALGDAGLRRRIR